MRFEKKVWLSSPTMHGDEIKFVTEAYETNWMSTVGANINELESLVAAKVGCKYAVALSAGTAALHLCTKLAGEALYGMPKVGEGALRGHKVFCSDMTFDATVNPVAYENGEAVFIDTEYDTWNMDPEALEKAFEIYPEVKLIVIAHLYGTPGKIDGGVGPFVWNPRQGRRDSCHLQKTQCPDNRRCCRKFWRKLQGQADW